MPYSTPEIRDFGGLYLQANSLTVPDGALEAATNVVLTNNKKPSKRRGAYQYVDPSSDTLNALAYYAGTLLAIMTTKIRRYADTGTSPNYTGNPTTLSGATVAITGTRIARTAENNSNLYATTDNGVLKLESTTAAVAKAGTPPAADLRVHTKPAITGVVAKTMLTAYRIVFGKKDANDNLILGAPSDAFQFSSVSNTVAYTSTGAGPWTVTVTDPSHGLLSTASVTVTGVTGTMTNAAYVITTVVAPAATRQFTFTVAGVDPTSGTLYYTAARTPRLEFSVPSEITSTTENYFYRVYKSDPVAWTSTAEPEVNFKLVDEKLLTTAQITNHIVYYDDAIDDVLITNAPELYTNENSQEGESQANERPPLCTDIAFYKGLMLFSDCDSRHLLNFSVVAPSVILAAAYIQVRIGSSGTPRKYTARAGVANQTMHADASIAATVMTVTYTAHGLSANDVIYASNFISGGTAPAEGAYTVATVPTADTFTVTVVNGTAATVLDITGLRNSAGDGLFFFQTSGTLSQNIAITAQHLVRAINRDASSSVYARYVSGFEDTPGNIRLQSKGFGDAIYLEASTDVLGAAFFPVLPTTPSTVYSTNEDQPGTFYASKYQENEAVPLVNAFSAGAKNKAILRSFPLRDSVIHLKEDGVYRTIGDSTTNLTTTPLDTTALCVAANSAVVLNNQVFFLSNQGVCRATETSVDIVSDDIKDVIKSILGQSTLAAQTAGIAYESEGLYILTTIAPNNTLATITYVYNTRNQTWTDWDTLYKGGIIGPSDTLFGITTGNKIQKERKNSTKIDFCGQNTSVTVVSVASNKLSAVVTSATAPTAGDIIVKSNVISRINAIATSGSDYNVTFDAVTNILAADTVIMYAKYKSTIRLAPVHAGQVGRMKQFAQMQLHTRTNSISRLALSFWNDVYTGSEQTNWVSPYISQGTSGGWGQQPWGYFPWGQEEGINIGYGTQPAPPIRILIPQLIQRSTYIQPMIEHNQAGEQMDLQSISFAVRGYKERVSV